MLVHIDNGLMAVVQTCFPDKVIGKFDMKLHTEIVEQIIHEWCVERIKSGKCTEDAQVYLDAWEEEEIEEDNK